ncbi:MAG: restriction endonuclease subunit S, partial [Nitrososphaerales archaeon]
MEHSPLPPGWSLTDIGSITSEAQPGFKCGKRDGNGFVQLRTNNIGLRGVVVQDSVLRIPRSLTNITRYKLQKGDILFNNTNTPKLVGKTVLFTGETTDCVYSNHITRLRVIEGLAEPSWLAWFLVLQQQVGAFERICHRSVNQATVSGSDLLRLRVPLPPFAEQLRTAARIGDLLGELGATRQALEKAHSSMEGLRRSLMVAACRGDLTERDQYQVPARRILERVTDERKKRRAEGGRRGGDLSSEETDGSR